MRVAITGSTGLVGRALAQRLRDRGDEVAVIVRGRREGTGVDWAREGAFDGCEAVVHLGGASIGEGRWTAKRKAELRNSRIESTRVLVAHLAALEPRPRRLLVASAVGYYGDRGDEPLSEASATPRGLSTWSRRARSRIVISRRRSGAPSAGPRS